MNASSAPVPRSRPFVAEWRDAIRDSDLPPTVKLIAFVLSTYMNSDGRCFPSLLTIAAGAGLSTRTKDSTAVKRAVATLEAGGFLQVTRKRGWQGWNYAASIPRPDGGLIPRPDAIQSHAGTRFNPTPRRGRSRRAESEGIATAAAPNGATVVVLDHCLGCGSSFSLATLGERNGFCKACAETRAAAPVKAPPMPVLARMKDAVMTAP